MAEPTTLEDPVPRYRFSEISGSLIVIACHRTIWCRGIVFLAR